MHNRIFFFGALATILAACSSTTTTSTNPPSSPTGGATSAEVTSCKDSCDKMKFFDCNSAAEQAACYQDCDGATPDQIQLFTGCANNSVCDPACRTNITPKASDGGSGTNSGGGGATTSSCGTACDKLISCSLIPVGAKDECNTECQKTAYQYQIDCVNNATCDKISASCGNPTSTSGGSSGGSSSGGSSSSGSASGGIDAGQDDFDIQECQSACDSLNFFSCLSADDHAACRTLCTTSTTANRDSFRTCANGAGSDCTQGMACYTTFKN